MAAQTDLQQIMRIILGLVASLLIVQTHAQTTVPTCTRPNWDLLGPQNQSPCDVLFRIMTSCAEAAGTTFNLTSVHNQTLGQYPRPEPSDPLARCKCTDIAYNLYSACGACQSDLEIPNNWQSHESWFTQCFKLPPSPPVAFASPLITLWMNQTYLPTFDIDKALQVQSTGDPLPSQTVADSSSETSLAAPISSTSSGKSNTPTIVGAVIGGVIGLVLLVFLIRYLVLRQRAKKRTPASAEFMKYAQGHADMRKSATTPLTHVYNGSVDESLPMHTVVQPGGYQDHRASIIRLDKDTGTNELDRVPMGAPGSRGSRDVHEELPAFTPGLFKDPIFEKGVALNLAAAAAAAPSSSSGGHGIAGGGAGGSPVTYSPATPSVLQNTTEHTRLIPGKQNSAGSAV
ncbi:SubName: Full=Uncharacterized protein {ECO:0000313/EMBL:CCA70005.1} [Serendipita indica DSM 11827]|uniref:Uncharacterized protein n=1 Tax=Serendipita indica (strain DSM 11827) TaxID=1109443 RepID=G4TFA4_SERID|nr:SubName: Full=Uncharacterized protein {ECO:0000313/EMBL:CCA70005.1} [Serendipita indica DSM 11827]CCA70005.1 hypothetical protein PIIN_03945 [Serendipita indica DSM 11827]